MEIALQRGSKNTWFLRPPSPSYRRGIEVNLLAPDPEDPGQLFWLWRKATRLVEMLQGIPSLPHLTIRLQKCESQDWHNPAAGNISIGNRHDKHYDHDVVILPSYKLRNAKSIKIDTHSEVLKSIMDWNTINWASEVLSERNTKHLSAAENIDQIIITSSEQVTISGSTENSLPRAEA